MQDDEVDADYEDDNDYPNPDSVSNGYATPPPGTLTRTSSTKRTRRIRDDDDEDDEFKPDQNLKRSRGSNRSKYQLDNTRQMVEVPSRPVPNLLGSSPGPPQSLRRAQPPISNTRTRATHQLREQGNYTQTADDEYYDEQAYNENGRPATQNGSRRH